MKYNLRSFNKKRAPPNSWRAKDAKITGEQSSVLSQPASANKDERPRTTKMWSDTGLLSKEKTQLRPPSDHRHPPQASKQVVSLCNRLRQQGKRFLYHREDSRTLLACAVQPKTSSTPPNFLHRQRPPPPTTSPTSTQCPIHTGCASEEEDSCSVELTIGHCERCLPSMPPCAQVLPTKSKTAHLC